MVGGRVVLNAPRDQMRICFGPILTLIMRHKINENTVWTDFQDYGADEILHTTKTTIVHKMPRFTNEIITLLGVSPQIFRSQRGFRSLPTSDPWFQE